MSKSTIFQSTIVYLILLASVSLSGQEAEIDSLFQDYSEKPGIAVAVYKDGAYVYKKQFGYGNLDYNTKITEETVFEVGSLAMHITASCILALEDEGKLDLKDDVRKYLSDLPNYKEGKITLQHLLNHTSGVMDYLVALSMSGNSWENAFSADDAYNWVLKNDKLGFTPGQEYEYSNSNYLLLNKIIQKLSGKSLNEYAQANLFEPLGMSSTFYYEKANQVIKNKALGYSDENGNYVVNHNYNFTVAGDGRLYTNLKDLMRWTDNLKNNKLPIANLEERLTKRGILNDGSTMSYALGLDHGFENGHAFYAHNGYWAGFSAMFLKFLEQDLWILTLSNNAGLSAPSKAYEIAGKFLRELPKKEIPSKKYRISKRSLNTYTGNYISYKNGYLREIVIKNDTLIYKQGDTERKLCPITKHRFKILGVSVDYELVFEEEGEGISKMTFLREGINQYTYEKYLPIDKKSIATAGFSGVFYNNTLDITYTLEPNGDTISVFVKGEKLMDYLPVADNIFCSESTHHGYLKFNSDKSGFTLLDYSFKPVRFEKIKKRSS